MINERAASPRLMKWWVIGCIGAIVLALAVILGLLFFVFRITEPVVDAADEFVTLIGKGELKRAYDSTAPEFRAATTEAEFESAIKHLGLDRYRAVSWHRRRIENSLGEVEGTVRTTNDQRVPIHVMLSHDGERWRVTSLGGGGEASGIASTPPLPSDTQAKAIVSATMSSFARAVKANDFSGFYRETAQVWQKETSAAALKEAFADFVQKGIDLTVIENMQPRLGPPRVDEKGLLVLEGSYDTRPSVVRFALGYAPEDGGWKLATISVNVAPVD